MLAASTWACSSGVQQEAEEPLDSGVVGPVAEPEPEVVLPEIAVDTVPILTEVKQELMAEYFLEHYGTRDYTMDSPQMVVVHYTVIPDTRTTLRLFQRDHLTSDRNYIGRFSQLNVSIHYVVSPEGQVYSLLPDTLMARHIIGFNHVSIGIENVAADSTTLTDAQLQSNLDLIRYLSAKYPSIRYMIGHMEYLEKDWPHYELFTSLNPDYKAYAKPDPGRVFLQKLRDSLRLYEVHLER